MIPSDLQLKIRNMLSSEMKKDILISDIHILDGGCINNTYKITTNFGNFFLKWNNSADPNMFRLESKSLQVLRDSNTVYIPQVILCNDRFIVMEFVRHDPPNKDFWIRFGKDLANLHKVSDINFGLDYDNFIGSLKQYNKRENRWIDFFIQQRIIPQLNMGNFPTNILNSFDTLFSKIDDFFPVEDPSLLHGDLWSGNFIPNHNRPVLIDPAIYFGSREMDIAMTKLFGGFDANFYSSYNSTYPLKYGWQERLDLCNLYPILVHVNLFGGGYYTQLRNILAYFV